MKLLTAVTLAASVIGATAFENCVTKEAGGEVFFLCDEPRDAPGIEVMKELEAIGFKGYQWRQENNGVADVETDLKARDLTAEKRDPHNAPPALEDRGNQRRSWWPSLPKVAYMYYKTPAKTPVQEDIKSDSDAEKKKAPAPVAGEKERRSRWPFIPKTEYMYYKTPASAPVKEDTKADSDAEKKEKRSRWPFIPKTEYMYYKTPTSQEGDKPAPDA